LSLGALAPVAKCLLGKRDGDARRIVESRLERAEEIHRGVRHGALARFAKYALGERDSGTCRSAGPSGGQPARIVSLRLENARMLALFPVGNPPGLPLCLELGALPITPFYNT